MLLLSVLGLNDDEIVADYVLSDNAYKEIGDKKAMVASLKQVCILQCLFKIYLFLLPLHVNITSY